MSGLSQVNRDPLFDVSDRVFLIAGAGGGLAGPIVRELAARGARLVLFDRDADALAGIQSEVPDAICEVADMREEAAITRLAERAREVFGRLDGGLNAAGTLPISPASAFDEDVFRECIDTNVTAAFWFSRAVAAKLGEDGGRIVHLASVSSYVSNVDYAAYASSKAALAQMVRVLGREWATRNVLVNAIGPALTETRLTRGYLADPGFRQQAVSAIPMGRLGEPGDLVGTVILLLSNAGSFITGQTIYVDGGRTLV